MMITALLFSIFGMLVVGIRTEATTQHDQCVDEAFINFHRALTAKHPQSENFTNAIPSSRHLFQYLLTEGFTADSFKNYCRSYEAARKEYDHCVDSTYKKAVLSGFGLADYMCLKRTNDYANGISCLEKADKAAKSQCKPKCAQYEAASYSYLHPTDSMINGDMTTYMAGDCLYLKCWTGCREPTLQQQCDNKTAFLELDSLVAAYSALHDVYELEIHSATSAPGHQSPHFPNECRPFVTTKISGSHENVSTTAPPKHQTRAALILTTHHGASGNLIPNWQSVFVFIFLLISYL